MKHVEKLIKLIELLEVRNWQYEITHDDRFQIHLGNYFYDVSKYDVAQLQQIIDDIEQW